MLPVAVLVYWSAAERRRRESTGGDDRRGGRQLAARRRARRRRSPALCAVPVAVLAVRYRGRSPPRSSGSATPATRCPGIVVALALVFFGIRVGDRRSTRRWRCSSSPSSSSSCRSRSARSRGALLQVPPRLEEAARSLGRGRSSVAADGHRAARRAGGVLGRRGAGLPDRDQGAAGDPDPAGADRLRDAGHRDLEGDQRRLLRARRSPGAWCSWRVSAVPPLPARRRAGDGLLTSSIPDRDRSCDLVAATGLHKSFGDVAPSTASTSRSSRVRRCALLGPSGCGKTTTLRLIAGFERPDAGTVDVGGRSLAGPGAFVAPQNDGGSAMVFQDYALFPHLDVAGNVGYGARPPARPRAGRTRCSTWSALAASATAGRTSSRAASSSASRWRGRWRRAPSWSCSTSRSPTSTPSLRAKVAQRGARDPRAQGVTAVFVTHDQEEALSVADSVAVDQRGAGRAGRARPRRSTRGRPPAGSPSFLGEIEVLPGDRRGRRRRVRAGPLLAPRRTCDGEVDVLIRPESLAIGTVEPAGPPASLEATVVARSFYGHDQMLELWRCPPGAPCAPAASAFRPGTRRPGPGLDRGACRRAADGRVTAVRLDIEYDGAEFSGWARQPGLRTVQGELEAALATILREPVELTVAGRTDAGVHARGQVAELRDRGRAAGGPGPPPERDRPRRHRGDRRRRGGGGLRRPPRRRLPHLRLPAAGPSRPRAPSSGAAPSGGRTARPRGPRRPAPPPCSARTTSPPSRRPRPTTSASSATSSPPNGPGTTRSRLPDHRRRLHAQHGPRPGRNDAGGRQRPPQRSRTSPGCWRAPPAPRPATPPHPTAFTSSPSATTDDGQAGCPLELADTQNGGLIRPPFVRARGNPPPSTRPARGRPSRSSPTCAGPA